MNVIVKIYRSRTKKTADLRRLNSILHSHVHTLIGQSPVQEPSPYLVISDYAIQKARPFLEAQILSLNDVGGFMASLSMLAGVASALQYLSKDIQLRKADLEECVKVSNLYVTPHGKVVVGRVLFAADPEDSESDDTISRDLSEWLKLEFWYITMGLLYGDRAAIDWTQWQSVQTGSPHIRPLLTLSSYHCPTFALMSERLTVLADALKPAQNDGQLTYAMIRKEMLKLPHSNPTYFLVPPVPIDIAYGDIGYMKGSDGSFVKLDNMRDAFKDETKINPDYEDYLRSSGAGAVSSEDLGDGVIRHTFEDTVFIEIARWRDPQCVADVYKFWPLFIDKARMIKRSCGKEHKFAISDLLFVVGLGRDYRHGSFTFDLTKGTNKTVPCVQLMEYTNAGPDEKWAEWIVVDEVLYSPDQIVSTFQRHPQYIDFVQLEKGDVPELEDGPC